MFLLSLAFFCFSNLTTLAPGLPEFRVCKIIFIKVYLKGLHFTDICVRSTLIEIIIIVLLEFRVCQIIYIRVYLKGLHFTDLCARL